MRQAMRMLAALGLVLGIAFESQACSCAPPPPPKEALEASAAVFSGKVTKIEKAGEFEFAVTVEVAASWKGADAKTITVRTGTDGAICGYGFAKGTSYLIYARETTRGEGEKAEKLLLTNICTRTKALADAKEDLEALGPGKKTKDDK